MTKSDSDNQYHNTKWCILPRLHQRAALRAEEWVVCNTLEIDKTLDVSFFVLEWTILKKSRLQSTQDGNIVTVFLWKKGKIVM